MMKFKWLLPLETIYLQNTIPPACSIHQSLQINTFAPCDQFQWIQISAELKQWLLTAIHHYSPLLYWCTGIRTYVRSVMWLVTFSKVWGSCAFCTEELYYKHTYYLHHSKGSLYFVCFRIGVTYQTSVIENCSEADWDEVGWSIILIWCLIE